MTDIVAELRRLAEKAPQGKWESVAGRYVEAVDDSGDFVIAIARVHQPDYADLIVAMHEALPALLRMVESLRLYVRHMEQDNPDDPDQWIYLMGRRWEAIVAALAKLQQGEVTHD